MKSEDSFFLIFLATILLVRIFLFFYPTPGPTISGFRLHHWMFGIVLLLITLAVRKIPLLAVGLALFVDELTYIIINGENHADNYALLSLVGTVFFVIIIFWWRSRMVEFFLKNRKSKHPQKS